MKSLIFAVVIACAQAHPDVSQVDQTAKVLKFDLNNGGEGSYNYAYETSNGIVAEEAGALTKSSNSVVETIDVKGSFKYTSPEGEPIVVSYIANENGFQPQGSHLPTPPPVPEYVQRAIQFIEAHPPLRSKF